MSKQILLALAVSASLGLAACGPSEEPKQGTAEPAAPPQTEKSLVERAAEVAKEATEVATERVEKAAEAASEAAGAAMETSQAVAESAAEKGRELAEATIEKAKELIQQVKDYIAENRLDEAQGLMEQLRKLGDALPEALQAEVAKLEAMLGGGEPEATPAASPPTAPAGQ